MHGNLFNTHNNKHGRLGQFIESHMYESSVARSTVDIRLKFLKKVYGILAAQLAVTVVISALVMYVPSISRGIVMK